MTLLDDHPARRRTDDEGPRLWRKVEDGFWVGNDAGTFVGTIESHGVDRYFARSATRTYIGEYSSLASAMAAVAGEAGRRA